VEGTERGLRGFLGLGSNVGDRLANLRAAAERLPVVARSSVYETEPQGEVLDQPDFLNAAVQIETALEPDSLLQLVKEVEAELGRDFSQVRHGPRVVDIDLLLLGDISMDTDRLTLPHREVLTRRFVLAPLLELDPELTLPDGTRLAAALAALEGQRVQRVGVL
jgi:2-amino-4-hydroxy-6-hydroxymethyldihydropteridine diphosphokinase